MKKEGQRVIISTFFEGYAVKVAIQKLSPDRLILLIDEPSDKRKQEQIQNKLKELKNFYSDVPTISIIEKRINTYDFVKIIEEAKKIIEEESKTNNKIILHITEGRKIPSLALLFAGYLNKEKIESACYITEEEHKLIYLPIISFNLGETKKKILTQIEKGNGEVKKMKEKLEIEQSAVYQHIQELKQEGYIGDKMELTELGRIALL
jgi:CRISPR locus-related DNA-binding protein